jgi:hypothetical protein
MPSSCLPPSGLLAWEQEQSSTSVSAWQARVTSLISDYVAFLRAGVPCPRVGCGGVCAQASRRARVLAVAAPPPAAAMIVPKYKEEGGVVDLTEDDPPPPPPKAVAAADHEVIELDDDDAFVATVFGPRVPAPTCECPLCGSVACAACGEGLHVPARGGAGGAAPPPALAAHGPACPLRYAHAVAGAVEELRRVYLEIDTVVDARTAARVTPAPPTLAAASGAKKAAQGGKALTAAAAAAAAPPPTLAVDRC